MQIPVFLGYFILAFLNPKHIQNITYVKQIYQICLHDIYLLALVFKPASLCNWQHLDLQVFAYMLVSFIQIIILKGV